MLSQRGHLFRMPNLAVLDVFLAATSRKVIQSKSKNVQELERASLLPIPMLHPFYPSHAAAV